MESIVGGALVSASMKVLVGKLASGDFVDLFRRTKLDDELLEKLKITLLSLQSVLHDAEDKQISNPAVKKWLEMLQDAVFEADELFDELNTEALRCEAEVGQAMLLSSCNRLAELPKDMEKMGKLRHLDITNTYRLKKMPTQISKLENLQTMSNFTVSNVNDIGSNIEDLGKYPHLREAFPFHILKM